MSEKKTQRIMSLMIGQLKVDIQLAKQIIPKIFNKKELKESTRKI